MSEKQKACLFWTAGNQEAGRYLRMTDNNTTNKGASAQPSGRVDVRAVPKPWGHEHIWAHTDSYVGKVLHIKAGQTLSDQYVNIETTVLRSRVTECQADRACSVARRKSDSRVRERLEEAKGSACRLSSENELLVPA